MVNTTVALSDFAATLPLPCLLQKGSKLFCSMKNAHQNSEKANRDGVVQLYLPVIKIFEKRQKCCIPFDIV